MRGGGRGCCLSVAREHRVPEGQRCPGPLRSRMDAFPPGGQCQKQRILPANTFLCFEVPGLELCMELHPQPFLSVYFETGSHYIARAGLNLTILLSQPQKIEMIIK